ncbi:MAG: hydrogenase iron-sulfur subunit [Candidatus Jordarchaeum sp.]|uniref:hydrogenase iron-sulfur subunit n=1 Tax=Candidatus Jordarchaeum sp. TaxID=2823881 RepID=UPI00404AF5ED
MKKINVVIPIDLYNILGHPLRRKILLLLEKEGYMQYSDLLKELNIETTGQLNFHLTKLGNLITKDGKAYRLSEDGKTIIRIMELNEKILSGEEVEKIETRKTELSRVGIIICTCGSEVEQPINVESLKNRISRINNVVSVAVFDNLCQEKNQKKIQKWFKDNFINKVVIAACSPRTHSHIFYRIFENLIPITNIDFANIREQLCWVNSKKPVEALEKARLLIEAAVERVILQKEIKTKTVEVQKSVAIMGGGIAGMNLALKLAEAGLKVYIIEKSPTLGGKVARWSKIEGVLDCASCFLSEQILSLVQEKNIEIFTNTEILNVSGSVGNFTIELVRKPRYVDEDKCTGCKRCMSICTITKKNEYEYGLDERKLIYIPFVNAYPYSATIDEEDIEKCRECRVCERACLNKAINLDQKPTIMTIKVGAKILAIGSDLYQDLEKYNHNPSNDIITSAEFERILASDGPTQGNLIKLSDGKEPQKISIIQNVGNQHLSSDYCYILSRKYLEMIREKLSDCEVEILIDNEMVPENRLALINFPDKVHSVKILEIKNEGNRKIINTDKGNFESDLIILNIGMVPNKDLSELRKTLDFAFDDNGFMSKETLSSGIYGCGTVTGPKDYHTTIAESNDVALQVISLLSKDYLLADISGIEIDYERCGLCGLCVSICPFNAISCEDDRIVIDDFKCKGCGVCVSICPTKALEMNVETREKILKSIEVYSKYSHKPKIMAFCCEHCGYAAADEAGLKKIQYNPNIFIEMVPCTGRVDTEFILKSLEQGFDGVLVVGCKHGSCRYIDGINKLEKKIKILKDVGIPKIEDKLVISSLNAVEGYRFAEIVNRMHNKLSEMVA